MNRRTKRSHFGSGVGYGAAGILFLSLLLLTFLLLLAAGGCASSSLFRSRGIYHVVKDGENLFRIGKAYGVPYRRLARLNRITDPHRIRAGQRIFVPNARRQLPVEIITPTKASLTRPVEPWGTGRQGFLWPVTGRITSNFGPRSQTFHDGVDIAAPEGTPVRSVQRGRVMYSGRLRGYGNLIIIQHRRRVVSVYAHNRRNLVRRGDAVTRGEVIAEVGRTGRVSGPHLHFEVRQNNVARNPLYYLP